MQGRVCCLLLLLAEAEGWRRRRRVMVASGDGVTSMNRERNVKIEGKDGNKEWGLRLRLCVCRSASWNVMSYAHIILRIAVGIHLCDV